MSTIFQTMYTFFQNSKLEGSYLLLFALSIVILYTVNEGKHRYLSLYPVVLVALVVANPITVWLLSLIFPVVGNFEQLIVLIPMLIYIPFAVTELVANLRTHKERVIVAAVLVFFISICGNLAGLFGGDTVTEANKLTAERKELIAYADANTENLVLADDEILPFLTAYGDNVPLLYGQDLMMFNSDLGIMDTYDPEVIEIHNLMWTPETTFASIVAMAEAQGCDIIIIKRFDGAMSSAGNYKVSKETDNYLVYKRN